VQKEHIAKTIVTLFISIINNPAINRAQ